MAEKAFQKCINPDCGAAFRVREVMHRCSKCGSLLDAGYEWNSIPVPKALSKFTERWGERDNPLNRSGVWRFRELLPFDDGTNVVTIGEGGTSPMQSDAIAGFVGMYPGRVFLQHEGYNPTGSFKDNGMTAAFTHAKMVGASRAACASTGNTSASMAAFAATVGMEAIVFIGSGQIAYGKLCQAMGYGARVFQLDGNFDDAMARVAEVSEREGIYLMNSVNPFRLEGQKTIMYRALEGLGWEVPDWIVVPGGNLGNSSAFGKAFLELKELGLIDRVPRMAIIVSEGASTLCDLVEKGLCWNGGRVDQPTIDEYYNEMAASGRRPNTIASAIEISIPINLKKALRALDVTDGVVRKVSDEQILDSQAALGRSGFGCEPASAATVAGVMGLVEEGVIAPDERIVCILTGHMLKDPDAVVGYHSFEGSDFKKKFGSYGVQQARLANRPVTVDNDIEKIIEAIRNLE